MSPQIPKIYKKSSLKRPYIVPYFYISRFYSGPGICQKTGIVRKILTFIFSLFALLMLPNWVSTQDKKNPENPKKNIKNIILITSCKVNLNIKKMSKKV